MAIAERITTYSALEQAPLKYVTIASIGFDEFVLIWVMLPLIMR